MKKLLAVLFAALFAVACMGGFALAETPDLASMDFEALTELKTAVDAELNSRPEAEKFELYPGNYTVGEDIKAGKYYVILNHPKGDYAPRLHIYKTQKQYDERPDGKYGESIYDGYFDYEDAPELITLAEGNYLYLQNDSLTLKATKFTEDDYYKYPTPEGTYVAKGIYSVGENGDIPAGSYEVYTATDSTITAGYYCSQEDFKDRDTKGIDPIRSYVKAGEKIVVRLEEGYVFIIDNADAVMKKSKKLVFD